MIPALDIDPFCQAFFDDPYPAHAAMREAGAVVYLPRYDIHAVARYDDVRGMLMDWGSYCSARGVGMSDFAKEKPWRLPSLLLETDPPLHDRTRKLMDKVLSPAAVRALRDSFASAADSLIDDLLVRGTFDAVRDLAEAYPLTVFPDAVGMPAENRRFLLPYGNMVFNSFGPRNAFFEAAVTDAEPVLAWVQAQSKREALTGTGFGAVIHAATDTGEFTTAEAEVLVRSLLTAGVDTTVNGLCAAVYCLARFPAVFTQLRADPSLARAAFEEAVRLESPVQTFFRTTTREVTIGDETVPEGTKVLMFLGAANRDPRRWEQPDDFDITRRNAGHVGFGTGIHGCVGAVLARLEGELVLNAIARKVESIEIVGEPKRRYNNTLRGMASLPVRMTARGG
ncbi:MAG TPA: cytochrome P450 [Acetobacteraceae bacterium]|jgi:4-methoxybenzoate monooxygenase (O-demethylating)|nr:cytochrome P450 [Acetobacteraceae bacterium]